MALKGLIGRDVLAATDRYKAYTHDFHLDMARWRKFRAPCVLNWTMTRFLPSSRPQIPATRGIYVFTLRLEPSELPAHGMILYMGITGDKSSATLRSRFGQYLQGQRRVDERPKVLDMLLRFEDHLFFNFAPIPDPAINLEALETEFLDAVDPPINERDYSGEFGRTRRSAW
ncbi:hypothetical protein [Dyella sp. A6]|uniref:hypothetical protein n=1 Tax=Dyella aluminiiresistens TaxID=3069105 RepID=UPI002E7A1FB4|nr:hypothetical protein [Dyella sp. A6]